MIRSVLAIAAVASLPFISAHAEVQKAPSNGNKMVKLCTDEDGGISRATCEGFLFGVIETTRTYAIAQQLQPLFCVPKGTPQGETVAAFTRYVEDHHAMNHFPAALLAISAFEEAFPCDEAGQPIK